MFIPTLYLTQHHKEILSILPEDTLTSYMDIGILVSSEICDGEVNSPLACTLIIVTFSGHRDDFQLESV